jgi:four helix bundle protein
METAGKQGRLSEDFRTRAKQYAAKAIRLFIELPRHHEEVSICGRQMIRAATSVAAHVREASRSRSDAEFISKLAVALQELDESQLWLELLDEDCRITPLTTIAAQREATELIAILSTMINRTKAKLASAKNT